MATIRARALSRLRTLPERHGRTTLVLLALILALGLGLRAYRTVEPVAMPGDDSRAYYALAESLYEEGSYGGENFRDPNDWSPGAPLLYSAAFYATGGAREGTARAVEGLLGLAAIVVVYLLGARLNCRPAGLLAAFAVAVYPPFIHSTGILASEPPAIFTLPAAVLAFLWASDRAPSTVGAGPVAGEGGVSGLTRPNTPHPHATRAVRWLVPGLLLGATALIRPEYLVVGIAFVVLAGIRMGRERGWRPGVAAGSVLLAGLVVVLLPWTVRNAIELDRFAPVSTGGGKALYVGTYLPADGDYQRVKALLAERYLGRDLEPGSEALDRVDPVPLFDRVAKRHPELTRDAALGRVGKDNLDRYLGEDPIGYAGMTVRKVGRMWGSGVGEAMSSTPGRVVQALLVLLALAGLAVLAQRRRWWEVVACATPIALVTLVGAATLAAPRRNEVLMTLVLTLAAVAVVRIAAATRHILSRS